MLMYSSDDIQICAQKLIDMNSDPIPKYQLVNTFFGSTITKHEKEILLENVNSSQVINRLRIKQLENGCWGRFHSQDSSIRNEFPTSEYAICLAIDFGLDKDSEILKKASQYLVSHMNGTIEWIDPPEKHDNPDAWTIETKHYSAGALALFDTNNEALEYYRSYWEEVVKAAFKNGIYNKDLEREERIRLDKCKRRKPIPFDVKHPLAILSSTKKNLSIEMQTMVLDHVMNNPNGIYYVYPGKINDLSKVNNKSIYYWIKAQMLLSRFDVWKDKAEECLNWLWSQRKGDRYWDFGSEIPKRPYTSFPLSESWKKRNNRIIDQSMTVLMLLSKIYK